MSKTPKIIEWASTQEGAQTLEKEGFDTIKEVCRNADIIGPFKVSEDESEGGEGCGESAWFVWKVKDTRDGSVEYVKVDLGYYSYDGFQWSDVSDSDFYVVEKKQVLQWTWEPV